MFLKQLREPRVFNSLLFIGVLLVLSNLGVVEAHDMTASGMLLAGIGNIDMGQINELLEEQGRSFEEFKARNDKHLKQLDKEVMEILKKNNRRNIGGGSSFSDDLEESKSDLATMIRSRGEVKGMFSGSGPDGGWTVAPVLADGIGGIVRNASALNGWVKPKLDRAQPLRS